MRLFFYSRGKDLYSQMAPLIDKETRDMREEKRRHILGNGGLKLKLLRIMRLMSKTYATYA